MQTGLERSISIRNNLKSLWKIDQTVDLQEDTSGLQSEGVYYCCKLPSGWKFYGLKGSTSNHYDFWKEKVLPSIVINYYPHRTDLNSKIYNALKENYCGFPRGRVSMSSDHYDVWNGNNLPNNVQSYFNQQITKFFCLKNPKFSFYAHEQCVDDDKNRVRKVFKIKEDWPSVHDV